MRMTSRELIEEATLERQMVDRFLDPTVPNWATFDPELGYRLRDSIVKDGIDGCYTISHYKPSGERLPINYAMQPCRINTYGNSFTQCHQVSDGETWQEYLAAHLGEPIRNFGVGGYGVYQAYRRMLREEKQSSVEYLLLNIWSDDHFRSLYTWRWLHIRWFRQNFGGRNTMFHANPWAHLRLNRETGQFEERENPYPTPESLYLLCDKEHVYETFVNDFDVQAYLAQQGATDANLKILVETAEALDEPTDFNTPEAIADTAQRLLSKCALHSSIYVVEEALKFAQNHNKKLMILLSYSAEDVKKACYSQPRFDQLFVDYLMENDIPFVDTLEKHALDFRAFSCSSEDYIKRYYIGHYNPQGNHFFAFAIKDDLVKWLTPKPPTYIEGGPSLQFLAATLA